MMKPTFAIIGCGRIAGRHAEQIVKHGTLLAVCDIVQKNADELSREYSARSYYSIEDLLANEQEVDIICICTPNGLHAVHAQLALAAGKHVLCEKPLCINVKEGREMMAAAEKYGRKLFVVKQNRYNPPVQALKSLLEKNQLGRISSFQVNGFWNRPEAYYTGSWKGSKNLDGGTLFTQFSHFIDLIYWMLGEVKSVKAITRNFEHPAIEIEDAGVVLFEMESGAIGTLNYTVNSFGKNMEGSLTIFGDKGTVKIGGQYLNTLEYQQLSGEPILISESSKEANDYGYYQGSMSNHDKVYEHLIKALNDPEHEFAGAADGLKTVEIIEKIYAAAHIK